MRNVFNVFAFSYSMATSKGKGKRITLLVFSSIFILLGALSLIFLDWTTYQMAKILFKLFVNTSAAPYVAISIGSVFLIIGVVLAIFGFRGKKAEA